MLTDVNKYFTDKTIILTFLKYGKLEFSYHKIYRILLGDQNVYTADEFIQNEYHKCAICKCLPL